MQYRPAHWSLSITVAVMLLPATGCQKKPADVPRAFDRPAFSFNYPGSWTIDEKREGYDPDHMFSIDASKGAMIYFFIAENEVEPSKALSIMEREYEARFTGVTKSSFTRWGNHDGVGTELRARAKPVVPTTIRIIAFRKARKTFVIVESVPDDEIAQLAEGYKLIQDSFRVKE